MAVEYTIPGILIRDHMVDVPLDWSKPEGETIRIFAREVCDPPAVAKHCRCWLSFKAVLAENRRGRATAGRHGLPKP